MNKKIRGTGCSLNFLFFSEKFKIYSGLWPLSVFKRCVHGPLNGKVERKRCSRTDGVQKNHNIKEKNTLYIMDLHVDKYICSNLMYTYRVPARSAVVTYMGKEYGLPCTYMASFGKNANQSLIHFFINSFFL